MDMSRWEMCVKSVGCGLIKRATNFVNARLSLLHRKSNNNGSRCDGTEREGEEKKIKKT